MAWIENEANGISLPSGEVASFPPGVTREQAYAQLRSEKPDLFEKPSGFIAGLKSGAAGYAGTISSIPYAAVGGIGSQSALDKAGEIYKSAGDASREALPEPVRYQDVFEDYENEGLLEAASTAWDFTRETLGTNLPQMAPPFLAAKAAGSDLVAKSRVGRATGSVLSRFAPAFRASMAGARAGASAPAPPQVKAVLAVAGGVLAAGVPYFFGEGLQRQYEVASEDGGKVTPDDIAVWKAALASGPQAAMDFIFVALTGGIGRGAQTVAAQSLKQSLAATTTKVGKATLGKTIGKGAVESLTEFPTELMQTVLSRAQAGESISFEDVGFVQEMKDTVAGVVPIVGVLGSAGTYRSHRANKRAEKNWEKMSDKERRLRKSQDEARELSKQKDIERAEGIQVRNEARWNTAKEQAIANNDSIELASLQAQENTAVEIQDVIEAADSRNILTEDDGFRVFVRNQTNGRTSNIQETNSAERRRIRSVLSGLKVQEYVEEDGGASMPMFTREQFVKAVEGTRNSKSIDTDSVRQALRMGNTNIDKAISLSIVRAMQSRGYAQRVRGKKGKRPLRSRKTPYNESQYEELLAVGQENGRIIQGDFERITGEYGSKPYKEFISDMRVRGNLPKVDKVKGVFTPTTYQDIQEANDGRTLKVGDYDVTVEPSRGYFVRDANGEIVDGATNATEAKNTAKRLQHRSRTYAVKKNGQVLKNYKNKNNAKAFSDILESEDPNARVEVISNPPTAFFVDKNKSDGFATNERVSEENVTTSVLEYGFSPDQETAKVLMENRAAELNPGTAEWDVRSVEEKARTKQKLESTVSGLGGRLDEAQRQEFTTPDEELSSAPGRRIEGDQTQRNQTILDEVEQALIDGGVNEDVAAKVIDESVNAEGFFDPDLGGLRTIAVNLDHPTVRNAETEAELRSAVRGIVNHEVVHAMRDLDLFTMNEWKALKNATLRVKNRDGKTFMEAAQETYKDIPGYETMESREEEAVAEMYRQFYSDPNVRRQIAGQPRTLIERIERFMERLVNALSGIGFDDASTVIANTGRIQSRSRNEVRTLKDTEAQSQGGAAPVQSVNRQAQPQAAEEDQDQERAPLTRYSVTGPMMLGEFQRREEDSDKRFQDEYNADNQKRSVAGSRSSILTVPGDFIPSGMATKFSVTPESSDVSDYLLSKDDVEKYKVRDLQKILQYTGSAVLPDKTSDYLDLINSEIELVFNGANKFEMAIPVSIENFIYDIRTKDKSARDGSSLYRMDGSSSYISQDPGVPFRFAEDFRRSAKRKIDSDIDNSMGNRVISAVQEQDALNDLEGEGTLELISTNPNNATIPVPLIVVMSDLGKITRMIEKGQALSKETITMLHARYVSPVLDDFKDGGGLTALTRNMLRASDISEDGVESSFRYQDTPLLGNLSSSDLFTLNQTKISDAARYGEILEASLFPDVADLAVSIPFQRAYASIFSYVFEKTSNRSTVPLFRGSSVSRFMFDLSAAPEAQSIPQSFYDSDRPAIERALEWSKGLIGRTISIDGVGELSTDAETVDSYSEGIMFFFPTGSVMQQVPDSSLHGHERGTFTSGRFEVGEIYPYYNAIEYAQVQNQFFGNALLEAASTPKTPSTVTGLMPRLNDDFGSMDQDLFSEDFDVSESSQKWTEKTMRVSEGAYGRQDESDSTGRHYLHGVIVEGINILNNTASQNLIFDRDIDPSYQRSGYSADRDAIDSYIELTIAPLGFLDIKAEDELIRRIFEVYLEKYPAATEVFSAIKSLTNPVDTPVRNQTEADEAPFPPQGTAAARAELSEFIKKYYPTNSRVGGSAVVINAALDFFNGNKSMKDDGLPLKEKRSNAPQRGAFVTLKQLSNKVESFGGKFINDVELGRTRSPVQDWLRVRKWSIVNVDEGNFQNIGEQAGSNEGGMYRNEETGEQYYVKTPRDPEIGRNEILASKLYQLAGVEIADANPAVRNGEFSVASTFVPGLSMDEMTLSSERVPGVQENFVVDAWLGNWDVVGLEFDNLLLKDGRGIRIDPGGTMAYRAMGGLKNNMREGLWGPMADDVDSMRNPDIAFEASQVFDKVTNEDLVNGIDKVLNIPADALADAVNQFGPIEESQKQELIQVLEGRRRDLGSRRADIIGDDSPAAQFISSESMGKKFSLTNLEWEGKGTDRQETSAVDSFSHEQALRKVSESTNEKGKQRDIRIVKALNKFKTSPTFDPSEITPKEWGTVDNIDEPSYGVVVKDKEGNVVLREVANFYDGYHWSVAKGRLDIGESPLETAVRELREETGISEETVPGFKIIGALPGPYSSGNSDTYLYVAEIDGSNSVGGDPDISQYGENLLRDTPGFIPRISKDKPTISADRAIMDEISLPIALGERKPRKLSLSNASRVELTQGSATTKGDRPYELLQAVVTPPLVHKSLWDAIKDVLTDRPLAWFKQKFIDKYKGIELLVEKARALRGDDSYLLAGVDALKAAYLSDKSKGVTQEAITSGQVFYKDGIVRVDYNKKGLMEVLQPLFDRDTETDLLRDWHLWMIANREGRFEKEGRMVSLSAQERNTILETANREGWTEIFESVNRDYQGWNGAAVDLMVDTGVIDKAMGEIFKKYGDYIPFYREFEGEASERLVASIQDLVGEEMDLMEAEGRIPQRSSAQKARMPSMFGSITGVKPPRKAKGGDSMVVDPLTGMMRNMEAAITSSMKNIAGTRVMDDAVLVGMAVEVDEQDKQADTHVVRIAGENRYFNVADRLLHDSLTGMTEGHIKYLNFFAAPAKFLREMVTRSPDFIMANLLRDSLSTWSTHGGTTPIVDTMKHFFSSAESESSLVLRSAGLLTGFDNSGTSKDISKKFSDKLRAQGQTPGKKIPFWSSATKLWEWSGDVSTKSDGATRQSVYESVLQDLLEKGVSRGQAEAEAIYQAAEVINFSRRGNSSLAKIITAVIPFLNARVQGLDKLWQAGKGKGAPGNTLQTRNQALIGFISRASLIATTSLMYAGMIEDEDEYKAASSAVRDDNWIIPGWGSFPGFKIPIPFEVGFLFKTIPERLYHHYSGDQTYKQTVDAISRGVTSTLEFNVLGPQITKPAMEAMMNHSFYTGTNIVPWYLEDRSPEDQKRLSTNELAVWIGDVFNVSPMKTEHVLKGYTGTLGGYILTVADWGVRNLKGLPGRPTLRADQMMVARRFLQSGEGSRGAISEWYEFRNATKGILQSFNQAKRDGDFESAQRIFEENAGVISTKPVINLIDNKLKELSRAERYVLLDPKTDTDQKAEAVKRIDSLRNLLLSNSKEIMKQADLSPKFPFPMSIFND